jgi:8-oxo-dGTP pyrophosphatase MutT (NUDIX family)
MWELNEEFQARLSDRLKAPLPGVDAQIRMSPTPINQERFAFKERPDAKAGAVLILFHPGVSGIHFPLIQRPEYPGAHSGQVSFPGGKYEKSDRDLLHTALREAEEEVGANPSEITVLGTMSELYIPASNFKVLPVIGISFSTPRFVPEEKEVAQILSADVGNLMKQEIAVKDMIVGPNIKIRSPFFTVEDRVVWGATAMMLGELLQILEDIR